MNTARLHTLIVAGEPEDAALARRVLQDNGDQASCCNDVPEALSCMAEESFDLALVSLSMPRGDGLALVHHLRALYPEIDVVAMAGRDEMEEVGSAMALGVLTTLITPLTGDDVLVAADRARERRLLLERAAQPVASSSVVPASADTAEIYRRCAPFAGEMDPQRILSGLLEVCDVEVQPRASAAYLPSRRKDGTLLRQPLGAGFEALPETLDAERVARLADGEPLKLIDERLHLALGGGVGGLLGAVVLDLEEPGTQPDERLAALRAAAQLAGAALAAAGKQRAITKGGIRDSETGAYTFAYFGDVASRELDRALRHQRAFALLTLSLGLADGAARGAPDGGLRRALAHSVLSSMRGSDVVARRDDDTFYLLLPETGLLGALACRRRVFETLDHHMTAESSGEHGGQPSLRELLGERKLRPSSGISVFPGDGEDLGELIKLSQRRAEHARDGLWKRLGLDKRGFWEAMDLLTGEQTQLDAELEEGSHGLAGRVRMPLALVSRVADGLIRDAARDGLSGAIYLAGDAEFAAVVARAVESSDALRMRTWMLGPARSVRDPAARIRLPLTDSRLGRAHLLLCVNERGGYCLLGRAGDPGELRAFHTSDLEIVEGLVSALQREYHLQPELK